MLIPYTEMHVLTAFFVGLEVLMLPVQVYLCSCRPEDKSRQWYLILLVLLIFYNVTGGLFPDSRIFWLSLVGQNSMAYGSGFLMAAYFPYFFYRAFNLKALRFQALYGVWIFLLLPYLIFFVLIYWIDGELSFAVNYGLIVPFGYSLFLLWKILDAIRQKFEHKRVSLYPPGKIEVMAVYFAVLPWVCLSAFAYFNISQWVEVLVTNLGFAYVSVLFMIRAVAKTRIEDAQRVFLNQQVKELEKQGFNFEQYSSHYPLTKREKEIALLFCQGRTYKGIKEQLYISEKTVNTHVQNIYQKTGARSRMELFKKMGFAQSSGIWEVNPSSTAESL